MDSHGDRRIGLEQEFFLVDEDGRISDRADEFLALSGESSGLESECAGHMVEVSTPPVYSVGELAGEYLSRLQHAVETGRELGLRLYPLAAYPLPFTPALRAETRYQLQARTLGRERFLHAGRCAGVHLHLELAEGVVDSRVGVAYGVSPEARAELLDVYNLATALDPAIIALGRSAPFYEGAADGRAARTAFYRGCPTIAPEGLYAEMPIAGGLLPYPSGVEGLVEQQFARYHAWLGAMEKAGVDPELFLESNGLLDAAWNPVRLNANGTVELRGIDSNHPEFVLAMADLVKSAADRLRREGLTVEPSPDTEAFEVAGDKLLVPGFAYLSGELFHEAATRGVASPALTSYLDSVLEFATGGSAGSTDEPVEEWEPFKTAGGYRTTETGILSRFGTPDGRILEAEGLSLVLEACEHSEEQILSTAPEGAPPESVAPPTP